ncbi:hypothetical protein MRB53_026415 [Persea americana]|uniref:Uncharacterized protein n=1 Tax=Persea americana TaxID=3435 RepID=A0ACC2LI40_PERAE|nr:hypothetical protein MRB53_026415 [Persea americana]
MRILDNRIYILLGAQSGAFEGANASTFAIELGSHIRRLAPLHKETWGAIDDGCKEAIFTAAAKTDAHVAVAVGRLAMHIYREFREELHRAYKKLLEKGQDPKQCPHDTQRTAQWIWLIENKWETPEWKPIQTNEEESGSRNPNPRSPPILQKTPSPSSTSRYIPSPNKKKSPPENPKLDESTLENPDLGPFLLKLARDMIASGESANEALDYSIRASKSFERCAEEGEPRLEMAMSLHVVAAIYCSLGRLEEAVQVLERAIGVLKVGEGGGVLARQVLWVYAAGGHAFDARAVGSVDRLL